MVRTDEELMLAYVRGDMDSLEEIFQRYKKRLLNYALRMLRNLADAEDVVGEAFYILTRDKNCYKPEAKFSTWLYTVAHNLCIDKLRARKRQVFMWIKGDRQDSRYAEFTDIKPLADEVLEEKDRAVYVKKAIQKLPLLYREALILREYQELSYNEISEVLSCSVSKVKVLVFRARERLRREIIPIIKEAS